MRDRMNRNQDLEKARELADHCRYCGMPDYRDRCKADYERQIEDIAAALAAERAAARSKGGTMTDEEESAYRAGFIDGMKAFSWHKDGYDYVGTCGTLLKDVTKEPEQLWNYRPRFCSQGA